MKKERKSIFGFLSALLVSLHHSLFTTLKMWHPAGKLSTHLTPRSSLSSATIHSRPHQQRVFRAWQPRLAVELQRTQNRTATTNQVFEGTQSSEVNDITSSKVKGRWRRSVEVGREGEWNSAKFGEGKESRKSNCPTDTLV